MFPELIPPRALRAPIDAFVGNIVNEYADLLRAFSQPLLDLLIWMDAVLRGAPWWLVILAISALAWVASRRIVLPLAVRSEEHTSELQSRENLVCRLLLEKKKRKKEIGRVS